MSDAKRWGVVALYAGAMAWVEAAVVYYLRTMVHRIEPYQPEPLPLIGSLGYAELVREFATLVMLLTVGVLAGRNWRSRLAYSAVAFGVWDIAYYLWLVPLTSWPRSFGDWDILFLIPLPWWGPVWAPTSIAALMILFGTAVAIHDSAERPLWPGKASFCTAAAGVVLALYVFMSDSIRVTLSGGHIEDLRNLLPQRFHWPLFSVALAFIALPVLSVVRQIRLLQIRSEGRHERNVLSQMERCRAENVLLNSTHESPDRIVRRPIPLTTEMHLGS
jgi:hypothetical protein